jgi:hypothetical protein
VINYLTVGATRFKIKPIKGDTLQAFFKQYKNSIDKIKARGGKVAFIRPPSTGAVLERETRFYPRDQYWDRLIATMESPGFYYTDHPDCVSDLPRAIPSVTWRCSHFYKSIDSLPEGKWMDFPRSDDPGNTGIKQ